MSGDKDASREFGLQLVMVNRSSDRIDLAKNGLVGWSGNGGFQALNLAAKWGCKKIILVGVDMRVDKGSHWHGDHKNGMSNPSQGSVRRWLRGFESASKPLKDVGVQVINCSSVSALKAFPKMTFEKALAG